MTVAAALYGTNLEAACAVAIGLLDEVPEVMTFVYVAFQFQ